MSKYSIIANMYRDGYCTYRIDRREPAGFKSHASVTETIVGVVSISAGGVISSVISKNVTHQDAQLIDLVKCILSYVPEPPDILHTDYWRRSNIPMCLISMGHDVVILDDAYHTWFVTVNDG